LYCAGVVKAVISNQRCTVGFADTPDPIRSGRWVPVPFSVLIDDTGVKAVPVYRLAIPLICQPPANRLRRQKGSV
jgi:hypothetical protein